MTLAEEREVIYTNLAQEVDDTKKALAESNRLINHAIGNVKSNDTGDARENAGLDIAKERLIELYTDVSRKQAMLSRFQEIEESNLFSRLFPELPIPDYCMPYNNIGKAVMYSTLRLEVTRGSGEKQEMVIMLMPPGLNFRTTGCSAIDNPATRLMLNAKEGQKIPYTCSTGEQVVYKVLEVL